MSHSLTTNVKRSEGAIRPPQQIENIDIEVINQQTDVQKNDIERTEVEVKRNSIDYERTGLAD